MLSSSKLKHLSKRSLLFGDKIFNNLPFEIKNVAGNKKKALKKMFKQLLILHN